MNAPRIVITIEATTGHELINVLQDLLASTRAAHNGGVDASTPAPSATPAAQQSAVSEPQNTPAAGAAPAGVEPSAPRRGGRKKKDETAALPPAQPPAQPTAPAPTASDISAMFADIPSGNGNDNGADAPAAPSITREQLREIGNKFMETISVEATVKILQDFGVTKLSEVPEAKWPDIYKRFEDGLRAYAERAAVLP